MSNPFPLNKKSVLGYQVDQVDTIVAKAREQFANPAAGLIKAAELREYEFDLAKGGYSISAVDSALDRLEDAFAEREAKALKVSLGDFAFNDKLSKLSDLIFQRCERPKGKHFDRSGLLLKGYSRKQVDQLLARIYRHLSASQALDVNEVRRITFTTKRNGYAEHQVDAFISRTVELLQLEKNR